jgi:hypothetical protein
VIDPRGAFASPERFPGVQLSDEWPDEALARLGLDAATALVALSHDPKLDDPALELALPSKLFYIGALGSRRTHEKRLERLRAAGSANSPGASIRRSASTSAAAPGRDRRVHPRRDHPGSPSGRRRVIFGEFPVEECEGLLLAHSLRLAGRTLKKGRRVTSADFPELIAAGHERITARALTPATWARMRPPQRWPPCCNPTASSPARPTPDAATCMRLTAAWSRSMPASSTGSMPSTRPSPSPRWRRFRRCAPGRWWRRSRSFRWRWGRGSSIAARPRSGAGVALGLRPFAQKRAALIVTEQPGDPEKNYASAVTSSRRRIEDLGSHLGLVQRCAHRRDAVALALRESLAAGLRPAHDRRRHGAQGQGRHHSVGDRRRRWRDRAFRHAGGAGQHAAAGAHRRGAGDHPARLRALAAQQRPRLGVAAHAGRAWPMGAGRSRRWASAA